MKDITKVISIYQLSFETGSSRHSFVEEDGRHPASS